MPKLVARLIAAQIAAWERRLDRLGEWLNQPLKPKRRKS